MTKTCAIHQPNFLPRLSTLAKLLSADVWVVLDNVQFVRRDYQHRARLAELNDPTSQRWLSLSTHLPRGRSTLIRDARLVDAEYCARRVEGLLAQYFARSPYWAEICPPLRAVVEQIVKSDYLSEFTTMSTRILLDLCGWHGDVVWSSDLQVRAGRSERLADLTAALGADAYLCGTGGARYLDTAPFTALGLRVDYFRQPTWIPADVWRNGHSLSAVWALSRYGISAVRPLHHPSA